jgi:site-specific DNA-methyltransferase (adenine-specific)
MDGLYVGDCVEVLTRQENQTINLIITSPPYADARKNTYGGISVDEYVDWWMHRTEQFSRILTEDGSLIVNIKEKADKGERLTYVLELILEMRKAGWLWTEEYIWHKRNCVPGKWPNRFRDAWERCLHFTKSKKFYMDQDAVRVPIGNWAKNRLPNLSETDHIRDPSKTGSGFGKNVSKWLDRNTVYPTNVLHFATECGNRGHSATFPEELPEFFIKLLSRSGDMVCDPFVGSGTTCVVAKKLERNFLGIDIVKENIILSQKRLDEVVNI